MPKSVKIDKKDYAQELPSKIDLLLNMDLKT
jgi:hypothetical protein